MRYFVCTAGILLCLVLLAGLNRLAPSPIGQAWAADAQVASLPENGSVSQRSRTDNPNMTPWSRSAQMRCPGGQVVFLTTECGCRGACCNCAANARYLNHCTCQCSQNPPPAAACIKGFSVGRN